MPHDYWTAIAEKRLTRRRGLAGLAATGLASGMLWACGGQTQTLKLDDASTSREPGTVWFAKNDWRLADETKQGKPGGIYRGYLGADQAGHYDAMSQVSGSIPFAAHVYELLMARNRGPGIDPSSTEAAEPVGSLAESWEIAPDGMSITFRMRPNVKWHPISPVSGRVMDMDDWKTSLERHLAVGFYRKAIGEILAKTEYPDSRSMVWKLNFPFAPIFDRIYHDKFAYPIMPKELNANTSMAEKTSIGTGFKILESHQPSIAMDYRKHTDYWGGSPFIDQWYVPIIPEYSNRYAQFVSGNIVDFVPSARDVLTLHKDAPQAVIVANPIPDNYASRQRFGLISPENQPWKDPRVRIAIRRAIDHAAIAEFLSNKPEFERNGIPIEVVTMTHLPANPNYWLDPVKNELGKSSENYLFDLTAAKALASAAGFKDPIPVPYYVLLAQGSVAEEDQLVMDSLEKSGVIKLEVDRSTSRVEHNKYRVDGQYDGMVPQSSSSDDADYFVFRDYHSKGNPAGRQAFPNPKIDKLADAQRRELNLTKRNELLQEFQRFMADWMPSVPGRHQYTTFSFRWPWLHNGNYGTTSGNWNTNVSPPPGRPVLGGQKHWLDPEMPNRDKRA